MDLKQIISELEKERIKKKNTYADYQIMEIATIVDSFVNQERQKILVADEVGLGKQSYIVIETEFLGPEVADLVRALDTEGFQYDAEEGEQPGQGDQNQHNVDHGIAQTSAGLCTHAALEGFLRSFIRIIHHLKSSSFLVDGMML